MNKQVSGREGGRKKWREGGREKRKEEERDGGKGQRKTISDKTEHSHPERSRAGTSVCESMGEPRACPPPRSRKPGGSSGKDTVLTVPKLLEVVSCSVVGSATHCLSDCLFNSLSPLIQ